MKVTLERIKLECPNRGFNRIENIRLIKETEKNFKVWLEIEKRYQLIPKDEWRVV